MYGQYNPYIGAAPQMQQRLNNLMNYQQGYQPQSYPQQNYQQQPLLKGRPVGSIEEAKAAQIDLDGSCTFFPSVAEGRIYEKSIDLEGKTVFKIYQLVQPQKQPVYAESGVVQALEQRIEQLERLIKGGISNESNANDGNVTGQQ